MKISSFIKQFILYFIVIMTITNFILMYTNVQIFYLDSIVTIILLYFFGKKHTLVIEDTPTYLKVFFSILLIFVLYNLSIYVLIDFLTPFVPNDKRVVIYLTLLLTYIIKGSISIFIGLWMAKKAFYSQITNTSIQPIQVYSVTDKGLANHLINLLARHQIQAYINESYLGYDPLLSAPPSAQINIMLKNSSDYNEALKLISEFFQEDENLEPWKCPQCHEEVEGTFFICWNCGYEQNINYKN